MGTFFVTGASGGIGKEVAVLLTASGHRVIASSRSESTRRVMTDYVHRNVPGADVRFLTGDLSLMSDIDRIAREVEEITQSLDGVLLNAGVALANRHITSEGFETAFAVNHLGSVLMAHRLLPLVNEGGGGQIVVTGSSDHFAVKQIDIHASSKGEGYSYTRAYAESKFLVMGSMFELARRLEHQHPNVRLNVADPGWARTGLTRDAPWLIRMLVRLGKPMQNTSVASARLLVDMATTVADTGAYIGLKGPSKLSALVQDRSVQAKVYDDTMALLHTASSVTRS